MAKKGMLIVVSGPSGVGKGTVLKSLRQRSHLDLRYSISMTTRQPRPGEKNGRDYFFVTKSQFKHNIQTGKMLEYAQYVNNYYGTPLTYVQKMLNAGHNVVLEIEVQGAMKVRKKCPHAIFIFLAPPSLGILKQRLLGRHTESLSVVDERIKKATREIPMMRNYDYMVVNDQVTKAADQINDIVISERRRVERVMNRYLAQARR